VTVRLPTLLTAATLFASALEAQQRTPPATTSPAAAATAAATAPHTLAPFVVPTWAFPTSAPPNPLPPIDSVTPLRVPNSARSFTMAQVRNGFDIPDWFPDSHPKMPAAVQYGSRPNGRACAYCHLANGSGRPENGTLAGLPADYIVKQVAAFRDGTRLVANPASNVNSMHLVAKSVADSDVAAAAAYFSKLQLTRRNRVVEVDRAPRTRIEIMLFALDGAGTEPIAGRLIEVPNEFERHELRDPGVLYTTYVPRGALTRGRRVVTNGPAGAATACAKCHGPQLLGVGLVPPIAGRSPSNLLRQLINIRAGTRHDEGSAPMQAVVNAMTIDDMVAVAAWVGSRAPAAASPQRTARAH
jgi:cytochrome c553